MPYIAAYSGLHPPPATWGSLDITLYEDELTASFLRAAGRNVQPSVPHRRPRPVRDLSGPLSPPSALHVSSTSPAPSTPAGPPTMEPSPRIRGTSATARWAPCDATAAPVRPGRGPAPRDADAGRQRLVDGHCDGDRHSDGGHAPNYAADTFTRTVTNGRATTSPGPERGPSVRERRTFPSTAQSAASASPVPPAEAAVPR